MKERCWLNSIHLQQWQVSAGWLSGKTDGEWRVRTRSRAPWIPTRFCTYIACSSRGADIGACYVCFRLPHVLMNPGKLLSPRHSPSCGPAIAGHTSKKKLAEIRKAMSVGLAVIAAGGDERRFFPYPSFAGGLGELRGARGWLTWRCWPENAPPWCPAGRCRGHGYGPQRPRFWPLCRSG